VYTKLVTRITAACRIYFNERRPVVDPKDDRVDFVKRVFGLLTGPIGDSTKISLVDLFGLSEFAWLAFRYHPALG